MVIHFNIYFNHQQACILQLPALFISDYGKALQIFRLVLFFYFCHMYICSLLYSVLIKTHTKLIYTKNHFGHRASYNTRRMHTDRPCFEKLISIRMRLISREQKLFFWELVTSKSDTSTRMKIVRITRIHVPIESVMKYTFRYTISDQ